MNFDEKGRARLVLRPRIDTHFSFSVCWEYRHLDNVQFEPGPGLNLGGVSGNGRWIVPQSLPGERGSQRAGPSHDPVGRPDRAAADSPGRDHRAAGVDHLHAVTDEVAEEATRVLRFPPARITVVKTFRSLSEGGESSAGRRIATRRQLVFGP